MLNSKKSLNSKRLSADQAFYYIHVTLYLVFYIVQSHNHHEMDFIFVLKEKDLVAKNKSVESSYFLVYFILSDLKVSSIY